MEKMEHVRVNGHFENSAGLIVRYNIDKGRWVVEEWEKEKAFGRR